ncbi:hypothetical protein KC338_g2495 [Hortaea werneckii]|nr:hypothetical protein KC323_g2653 [Hortaea werneckii]KAI6871673.1 hypothetical protein KC338_g2495 [Hortaea werneckii]
MATVNAQRLVGGLKGLWCTGKGSDLTIRCEGRDFKVHKTVICLASPVLDRACNNSLLETHTRLIEHNEYDADTVERMIGYMYTDDYPLPSAPTISVPNYTPGASGATEELTIIGVNARLIIHARLCAIGEYYDIPGLRDLAFRRFKYDIQTFALEGFVYVVREVHELVSKDETRLRGIIRDVCFRNLDKFANDGFFMTAIASFPDLQDFSAMLLRQVVREREELKRELKHKDTEIREAKEDRDAAATHTEDVLATLIDVVRKLPARCPRGRCGNNRGHYRVRRVRDARYGPGSGYVEVKCGSCRATMLK